MTIEQLYSIYDNKAQQLIGGIIRVKNDEVARRHFRDALTNADSPLAKHPEDYDLLVLGTIDSDSGQIEANELGDNNRNHTVARGADFREDTK